MVSPAPTQVQTAAMPVNFDSTRTSNNFDDIQKWMMDIDAGKERLFHQWLGEVLVRESKDVMLGGQTKTVINFEWRKEEGAVPWMSMDGARALRVMLDAFISRDTLLSNNTEFGARKVTGEFCFSVVGLLADKYRDWNIAPEMRSPIISQLRIFTWLAMTRTIGAGNDRDFFKMKDMIINRLYKSPESGKGGLLPFPIPGLGGNNNA